MWLLVLVCVLLQLPGAFPSCLRLGSSALCSSRSLHEVPPLPPHVTHLYLEMNRIAEINASSLSGLEQLQVLDLGSQMVPLVIRNEAFGRLGELRSLVLGSNRGLRLEPRAFVGLARLEVLHLDYCSLNDSILTEDFLEPLVSLESLNLFGNKIKRIRPSAFFANMTKLKSLNLRLNSIGRICEPDLESFRGRRLGALDLSSTHFLGLSGRGSDWETCGNPFKGMSFHTLDLSHNGFTAAKARQFFRALRGTEISHLKLAGYQGKGLSFHNLPDPDNSTFEGLGDSSVLTLDLSRGRISALSRGVFRWLAAASVIDVSRNRVNRIDGNAFEGLEGRLQVLNLSHNLLGEVCSHTFASLAHLKVLDLSHNHIGVLGYGSFRGLPDLEALLLTGNSLSSLGFPSPLPKLQYLHLGDNRLSSAGGLAQLARNIKYLDIKGNHLTDLGDVHAFLEQLRELQVLLYGGNTVRWCTPGQNGSAAAWNKLQVLDLQGSSLQAVWAEGRCLTLFEGLAHVANLDLSSNQLRSLPGGVFQGLASVVTMDLSWNALTYLPPDVLPQSLRKLDLSNNFLGAPDPAAFGSLSHLDLGSNRFHCTRNLSGFLTWLNRTQVTLLSPVHELRCEFPLGWYRVPVLEYAAVMVHG